MNLEALPNMDIRTMVFAPDDLLNQQTMIGKLDHLIQAWGRELIHCQHIDHLPETDDGWLTLLSRDVYRGDLNTQWEHYLVACLIFFVSLRADIKRDFLLQPDPIRGQRLNRWLEKLRHYQNPLTKDIVTKFCLCYSMVMENKPIKVRYNHIQDDP
jgi:hypothetical protein